MRTTQEILNAVYDSNTKSIRLSGNTGSGGGVNTIQEVLNAVYDDTNKSLKTT